MSRRNTFSRCEEGTIILFFSLKMEYIPSIVGLIFYDIDSFVAKGNPMAIWECSVDTTQADKDHQMKWSRTANRTVLEITDKESQDKSIVKIEKRGHGYEIFFVTMSRYYSGNSEFPKSVVIEKGKKQRTVVYRKP
jgi:hypothetical protein